jgi:hypothetical protein
MFPFIGSERGGQSCLDHGFGGGAAIDDGVVILRE